MQAVLAMAEGQWERGATQFEAAWKMAGVESGRRKNLVSPSIGWIYLMALLAQPAPAAWGKARKFAASEAGKRDAADPFGFWGAWVDAIDQRLGDAPKAHGHFRLMRHELSGMQSLQYLHHLLLAALAAHRGGQAGRTACARTPAGGSNTTKPAWPGRRAWCAAPRPRCWARHRPRPMPARPFSSVRRRTAGARRWPRSWRWAAPRRTPRAAFRLPCRTG